MGIDRISGTDKPQDAGNNGTQDVPRPPPPDNPGSPGQPSRLESRAAVSALRHEAAEEQSPEEAGPAPETDQPRDKDDEFTVPAEPADDKATLTGKATAPAENEPVAKGMSAEESETDGSETAQPGEQSREEDAVTATKDEDSSADQPEPQADERSEDEPSEPAGATTDDGADREEPDEPGSWRGEGGQYLTKDQHQRVRQEYRDTARHEPEITAGVQTAERNVPDAQLVGLEYRLKGEERYKEKVAEQLAAQPLRGPAEIARGTHDAIRYTYQLPNESYAEGYEAISRNLAEQGHEMVLCRNSWGNPTYKGINTRWRTPEGRPFEVQFHTPESFQAKQETHGAYEAIRNPLTGEAERKSLQEEQQKISSSVAVPSGAAELARYEKGR